MRSIPRNVWLAVLLVTCLAAAGCPGGCSKIAKVLNPTSVQSVTVTPLSAQLTVGQTQQFTATVLPSGVSDRSVTWSVSPAAVASINANGVLTALAPGQAIVTATSTATPVHTAEAVANISAAQ
jgi:glucosylceramidase